MDLLSTFTTIGFSKVLTWCCSEGPAQLTNRPTDLASTSPSKASCGAAAHQALQDVVDPEESAPVVEKRHYETDEEKRKKKLEADPMGSDVTEISIVCRGCNRQYSLDKRNKYYAGLWIKHREKCRGVRVLRGLEPPKVIQVRLT
jgi:hypothetical protein